MPAPRTLSSAYERLGVTPEGLLGAPQGKALNQVANRLDSVVRRSEAEALVKDALAMQQMARTPTEKRKAASALGRARQALRRSMRELPNMPPDPKVKGAMETEAAATPEGTQ